jgi:hypothetical protein
MVSVKYLPHQLQTVYAELIDRCNEATFVNDFPASGTFRVKLVKGRRYCYYQYSKIVGKDSFQKERYVGPDSEKIRELITNHRQLKSDFQERRDKILLLKGAGVVAPLDLYGDIIEAMASAGVFRMRACLVGTLAFQTYEALFGVLFKKDYSFSGDVDVAQFREISIAIADTERISSLLAVIKEVDDSFTGVCGLDVRDAPCKFKNKSGVTVDILTPNRGADKSSPEPLQSIGTAGQLLRYLDYLIYKPIQAVVLHGGGVLVNVPQPAKFMVHKLIISQVRENPAKIEKDLWQAESLMRVILDKDKYSAFEAFREAVQRGKKWEQNVLRGMDRIDSEVKEQFMTGYDKYIKNF